MASGVNPQETPHMSIVDTDIPKPEYWEAAVAHLMRRDRILKKIIPQHPEVWLTSRGTPFVTLARAIIGQQVSAKACLLYTSPSPRD